MISVYINSGPETVTVRDGFMVSGPGSSDKVVSYEAPGRHMLDVSRTSCVSGTGTARGRRGDVSKTFQKRWGRQRFLGTAWLGSGDVS